MSTLLFHCNSFFILCSSLDNWMVRVRYSICSLHGNQEDILILNIALIADEAHHLSSATRNSGDLFGSWEGTVMEILKQSFDNILLEFTAILDYESREITEKYQDKVIFRYDLAQFRIDKYSKEINLIRSLYDEQEKIIQALILNLYRQELAISKDINSCNCPKSI